MNKGIAFTMLAWWYDKIEKLGLKGLILLPEQSKAITSQSSITLITGDLMLLRIINAKIQDFRFQLSGIKHIPFPFTDYLKFTHNFYNPQEILLDPLYMGI